VLEHKPGARLFKGLRPGATRESFDTAVQQGAVERELGVVPAKVGQCHYLPSGTIHALGAGILAAEVQTPSDTTFRVYDFNRVDPKTKKTRTLHIDQAMQCIDFAPRTETLQPRAKNNGLFHLSSRLVTSPYFTMDKVKLMESVERKIPYHEPIIWIMLEGQAQVKVDGIKDPVRFTRGEAILLPASMKNAVLKTSGECQWLEVRFGEKGEGHEFAAASAPASSAVAHSRV
jgi:mannose-6-phosphate isomerase